MNNSKETLDKLSWNNINQLHEAVSNFSKQSFDIKKLWVTVEISVITLLFTMTVKRVETFLIIIAAVLIFFYLLDSMTYFYQDKLREKMLNEQNEIRRRNNINVVSFNRKKSRIFRSLCNWSHLLYYIAFFLDLVLYFICPFL